MGDGRWYKRAHEWAADVSPRSDAKRGRNNAWVFVRWTGTGTTDVVGFLMKMWTNGAASEPSGCPN